MTVNETASLHITKNIKDTFQIWLTEDSWQQIIVCKKHTHWICMGGFRSPKTTYRFDYVACIYNTRKSSCENLIHIPLKQWRRLLRSNWHFKSSECGVQGTHMIRLTRLEVIIYRLPQLSTERELLMRGHSVIQSEFSNYNNLLEREIYPPLDG